jgi:hypothetical protein
MIAKLIKVYQGSTLEVGIVYEGTISDGGNFYIHGRPFGYLFGGYFEEVKDEKPISQGSTFHEYVCGTKKAEDIQIDAIRSVAQMECPVSGFIITSAESRNQLNLWADFLEKCKAESAKELG